MLKQSRYLITTADERTWKYDRPVIFLGEWCRVYERRHIWQDMDAIVAAPYGLGQFKKDADHAEARALEDKLFPVLCEVLNRYHDTQHGDRFWRIVLGSWLRRYVDVILNRTRTLEECLRTHQISGTTAYTNECYSLATYDSNSAIWAFSDNRWNNALSVRILELLGASNCKVEFIEGCKSYGYRGETSLNNLTLKSKILKWGHQQAASLASFFARDSDAFIINSYLPKIEEIKLQLALGQCPQQWRSPKLEISEGPNRVLRENLSKQYKISSYGLETIVNKMVFELLPVCYLENFGHITKLVKQQVWPAKPKFIFTSVNYDNDEVFKIWAALKTESGAKYIIGQHGSLYGADRHWYHNRVEEQIADKFLSWGWADGLPQHIPTFIFTTAGRKTTSYNPQGGLLLIELYMNHRINTWDSIAEYCKYFEEQQKFVQKIASSPRQQLTVRLHAGARCSNWSDEARWKAYDPALKVETGDIDIRKLIAQSRLVVHSYDSTGILETLSQNIPTLVFWQNRFDHLRESAKPYYQMLVDAGIVHLTPDAAGQMVNEIWDDVDGWWAQSKVQTARRRFCDQYARVNQDHIHQLKDILLQ